MKYNDQQLRAHQPRTAARATARAAVAMVLHTVGAHDRLLFIQRAESPTDAWSGQVALPGGHWHCDDTSLLATACRETQEELGLPLAAADYIGQLDDQLTRQGNLNISCFVFRLQHAPTLRPNHEVAAAFWVPLTYLLDPHRRFAYYPPAQSVHPPAPRHAINLSESPLNAERILWGLTYGFVQALGKISGQWLVASG